ncbi:MAG TPA: hypothetical protein VGD41_18085 [Pyrinomonadaceae bacterium]
MTTDQIINIVGQAATWLTLVIVFFTLREMNTQRRHSYKPELLPLQDSLFVFWKTTASTPFPSHWSSEPQTLAQVRSQAVSHPTVRVVNLGVGAASSVTATWQLQIDELVREINDYCNNRSIPVVVLNKGDWLKINAPGGGGTSTGNDLVRNHDYLLPAPTSPDGWALPFPFALRHLTSLLIYLLASAPDLNQVPASFMGAPPFTLNLSYRDLGGRAYTKKFFGKLHVHTISGSVSNESSEAILGNWEWTEIR